MELGIYEDTKRGGSKDNLEGSTMESLFSQPLPVLVEGGKDLDFGGIRDVTRREIKPQGGHHTSRPVSPGSSPQGFVVNKNPKAAIRSLTLDSASPNGAKDVGPEHG